VLLFELGAGARDIAGSPVNVASKLAQDVGEFGKIHVSDAAARKAGILFQESKVFHVSGAIIDAAII
jgi:hypothetical protein